MVIVKLLWYILSEEHSPLTPTTPVQLLVAFSSLTQALVLSWVGKCLAISKPWVTAVEDCGYKLPGAALPLRV